MGRTASLLPAVHDRGPDQDGFRDNVIEDLRQQACVKLWQGLEHNQSDPERARFRIWLARLIRNTALDWVKAQRSERKATVRLPAEVIEHHLGADADHEQSIISEWEKHLVSLAMERLRPLFSDKALQVFVLSLQGHTVDAIADQLALRTDSIYVMKNRVKTRVMQEIRELSLALEDDAPRNTSNSSNRPMPPWRRS